MNKDNSLSSLAIGSECRTREVPVSREEGSDWPEVFRGFSECLYAVI